MRHTTFTCVALTVLLIGAGRANGGGLTYTDGFEAPTLNPFWSTSIQSGSIALSTGQAHSGNQSVQLSSTDTGVTKSIQLFHDFSTPVYGVTSVWVLDTGAGADSSNYIAFSINNAALNFGAGLLTFDYGFQGGGPGRGDQYDYIDSPFVDVAATGIQRSGIWH